MSAWHENDAFWQTFGPFMFSTERLAHAAEEVGNLIALLKLEPGSKVLDLCCGVGRHSLELARRGFAVTAVDRTRTYLDKARAEAAAAGELQVEFVESDARAFVRAGAFDAAINLFTSFGFFDDPADDLRMLRNLHESLKPGGRLVIDLNGKEILARRFRARDWHANDDGTFLLEERKLAGGWDRIESRWILASPSGIKEGRISLRLYSGTELVVALKQAGFSSATVHGNLAGSPYDEKAARLVGVATK